MKLKIIFIILIYPIYIYIYIYTKNQLVLLIKKQSTQKILKHEIQHHSKLKLSSFLLLSPNIKHEM